MSAIDAKEYLVRANKFVQAFKNDGMDAAVISSVASIRYLCGYKGREESALVVMPKDMFLIVGKLHAENERRQTIGTTIVEKDGSLAETIGGILSDCECNLIGFESKDMTVERFNAIRSRVVSPSFTDAGDLILGLREVKSYSEIQALVESVTCAETAFKEALRRIPVNSHTEKEVATEIDHQMKMHGAGVISFPVRVMYGEHCGTPHMMPDDRHAKMGEPVMFDWGAIVDGYHSDVSKTMFFGPDKQPFWGQAFDAVCHAAIALEDAVKPGMICSDVYALARGVIQSLLGDDMEGGKMNVSIGHGIGLEEHESPHISEESDDEIKVGQVICLEPGLYFYGKGCVHTEDMYVVRENGVERLSTLPRNYYIGDNI
jgi:Xaa-Pro aminopeptidase